MCVIRQALTCVREIGAHLQTNDAIFAVAEDQIRQRKEMERSERERDRNIAKEIVSTDNFENHLVDDFT